MLNKSIPYKNIIMSIAPEAIRNVVVPDLPEGFSYRLFREGDEKHWARIETSVLEFDSEKEAEEYFSTYFLPHLDELKRRSVFIVNADGLPVATATAWFEKESDACGYRPIIQWVATDPACQGLGLGRAVVSKALSLFPELHPDREAFLHTQTWSNRAVWLYHTLGFTLCRTRSIRPIRAKSFFVNEYEDAVKILGLVLEKDKIATLVATSVE